MLTQGNTWTWVFLGVSYKECLKESRRKCFTRTSIFVFFSDEKNNFTSLFGFSTISWSSWVSFGCGVTLLRNFQFEGNSSSSHVRVFGATFSSLFRLALKKMVYPLFPKTLALGANVIITLYWILYISECIELWIFCMFNRWRSIGGCFYGIGFI